MSGEKVVRPWLVGLFVVGAAFIALAAVAALSSGQLFQSYRHYVVFFPQAVGGLKEGSPVTFRQVPVGRVRDVELVFLGSKVADSRIMAFVEIRRGAIKNVAGEESAVAVSDTELLRVLVDAGMRATVRSSSPIAGQRSIDLDFHPDQEPRYARFTSPYPEIPTAPTGMEVLNEKVEATLQKISEVPIDEVLLQLRATLASVQRLVDGREVSGTLKGVQKTLQAAERTLASGEKALSGVEGISGDARATLTGIDTTMKGLRKTLEQLDRTLATVDRNVERTAELQYQGAKAFDEMGELLKALRLLVDTLQRNPEALVRGKPEPEENK